MADLTPLNSLFDISQGPALPLPPDLVVFYEKLQLPLPGNRPYLIGNLVTTLDGVVSLNVPGKEGGKDISGANVPDRMVMGLLRAVTDVVLIGAGTMRAAPGHLWTAQFIHPPLAESYAALRQALGKTQPPLLVVVTASGKLNLHERAFSSGETPALIITTPRGAEQLDTHTLPSTVKVLPLEDDGSGRLGGRAVVQALQADHPHDLILVEGGPHFLGSLLADQYLDELFLTLAPQLAGRGTGVERISLVEGQLLAPNQPRWGNLVSLKRSESHLFLRYALESVALHD